MIPVSQSRLAHSSATLESGEGRSDESTKRFSLIQSRGIPRFGSAPRDRYHLRRSGLFLLTTDLRWKNLVYNY